MFVDTMSVVGYVPSSIKRTFSFSQSLPFPEVTFCNFNAIRNNSLPGAMKSGEIENFRQLLKYGKY